MIQAEDFIESARGLGFQRYTGVPCSFLTPFINYVINDDTLNYVSSSNEGDAIATAAGAAIGGERSIAMMQNSGLGNAVSPITSLSYMFRIPMIIITTHRGAPGITDEPQHELMGQITGEMFDIMRIPWETFPKEKADISPALQRASEHMEKEHRPYGFIMQKGTVASHELKKRQIVAPKDNKTSRQQFNKPEQTIASRSDALKNIISHTPESNTVVVATTGFTSRELFAITDRPNQLYMVGSMGCASSLGLGIALARPDLNVVVVEGDGAALMRMGNFATLGSYGGNNLTHIVLDNEAHDSTGAQATVTSNVRFADIAAACGYAECYEGNDIALLDALFNSQKNEGAKFAHLKISTGSIKDLPRPDVTPVEVLQRLMQHIGTSF
ncbi:MAG: phosphonopyruvate decarboxylase [Gammaproteobacteria bacterium]